MSSRRPTTTPVSHFDAEVNTHLETRTLAHHPELAEELFAAHQLGEYFMVFKYFTRNTPTDVYHGQEHGVLTALNCYEGALHSGCTREETRALLVAGLFHDVGHSCGGQPDEINVQRAKHILTQLHASMDLHARLKDEEMVLCLRAIGATQYPYRTKLNDAVAKVIRDADMMTPYLPEPVKLRLLNGLRQEMLMSIEGFCQRQLSFSSALVWNTRWAKMKAFERNWPLLNRSLPALFKALEREENQAAQREIAQATAAAAWAKMSGKLGAV